MKSGHLVFEVPDECDNMTVKTFLRRHCSVSARMLAQLKREKDGIIRGEYNLRTVDRVQKGDRLVLRLPREENLIAPTKGKPDILFEDDYIIALNKPPGMPVHPTKVHQTDTLANLVAYMQLERGEVFTFRAANRLDSNTSGIVAVAKNKYCASLLPDNTEKTYYAVCEGVIESAGTVDAPIKLLEGHTVQRAVAPDGARAVTHYNPLKSNGELTLLELQLETGRTHQIRCHLASIGHPLAGDDMYGGSKAYISRQALHCGEMIFQHPVYKNTVRIKCPLPDDIKSLINSIIEK